ncbi:MAG TPA: hypothetical protein VIK81_03605 [Patescibacteria group bacterium]
MNGQNSESEPKQITEATAKKLAELLSHTSTQTAIKSAEFIKRPFFHLRESQIIAGLLGTVGLITFALGIERVLDTIPILASPFAKIIVGLLIMIASGLAIKKLS